MPVWWLSAQELNSKKKLFTMVDRAAAFDTALPRSGRAPVSWAGLTKKTHADHSGKNLRMLLLFCWSVRTI